MVLNVRARGAMFPQDSGSSRILPPGGVFAVKTERISCVASYDQDDLGMLSNVMLTGNQHFHYPPLFMIRGGLGMLWKIPTHHDG